MLENSADTRWGEGVATGGTLFGNALSMAAARATLGQVLTEAAYEHAASIGARLADGIERIAAANDIDLFNVQQVYLANRGIWEAIDSAGPAAGIETTAEHVDRYPEVVDEFLGELRR